MSDYSFAGFTYTNFVTLTGTAGNDTLTGTSANDYLDSKAGADVMTGGLGDDVYVVENVGDVVVEWAGGGHDMIRTSLLSYTLAANVEDLQGASRAGGAALTGNAGANYIVGWDLADTLSGGIDTARDTLDGGAGNDTILLRDGDFGAGGLGADYFSLVGGSALVGKYAAITDYSRAQGDTIEDGGLHPFFTGSYTQDGASFGRFAMYDAAGEIGCYLLVAGVTKAADVLFV